MGIFDWLSRKKPVSLQKKFSVDEIPVSLKKKFSVDEILGTAPAPIHVQKLIDLDKSTFALALDSLKNGKAIDYMDSDTSISYTFDPTSYTHHELLNAEEAMSLAFSGESKGRDGKYGEAIPLFEKALFLVPGNDLLLLSLGVAYAEEGSFDIALKILQKAIELYPENQRLKTNYDVIKEVIICPQCKAKVEEFYGSPVSPRINIYACTKCNWKRLRCGDKSCDGYMDFQEIGYPNTVRYTCLKCHWTGTGKRFC